MLMTECRLWKLTLLVLVFVAIALIVTGGVLSKYAKDHNKCPAPVNTCPTCKVCKLDETMTSGVLNKATFKIKPFFLEKSYLSNYNKVVYFVEKDHTEFIYDPVSKTLQNDEGLYVVYRYSRNFNPDVNQIFVTTLLDYSLGDWGLADQQIRQRWHLSNNKLYTYPENNKEVFYTFAIDVQSNKAILQEEQENKNTIFEFL